MKKALAVLLALCIPFYCFSVCAVEETIVYAEIDLSQAFSPDEFASLKAERGVSFFALRSQSELDRVRDEMLNLQQRIDVSSFNIPFVSDNSYVGKFLSSIIQIYPEIFFLQTHYRYSHNGKIIKEIIPAYKMGKEELDAKLGEFYNRVHSIVSDVPTEATELEKVLYTHEYLTINCGYDTTLQNNDAYEALINGTSACQGYAMAFNEIVTTMGLNCVQVLSSNLNHIWNKVEIDGEYYHLDATWDDPLVDGVYDRTGLSRHEYFLLSDETIYNKGMYVNGSFVDHSDMKTVGETELEGSSSKFESGYVWEDTDNPIVYLNGKWYKLETTSKLGIIKEISRDFKTSKEVNRVSATWNSQGGGYYSSFYGTLFQVMDTLYINTPDGFFRCKEKDGVWENETVTIPANNEINSSYKLYGAYYNKNNGKVRLQYMPSPNYDDVIYEEIYLPMLTNGGKTWPDILIKIKRHLTLISQVTNFECLDINGDDKINVLDYVTIKKCAVNLQ